MSDKISLVVLLSGSGSNFQAILDQSLAGDINARVACVVSNNADAKGLERARKVDIETCVVDHRGYDDRESYDAELIKAIDAYNPDLVILAGFMRILTPGFVEHYAGRMLNIHPSLLPKYKGLHTHKRALEAGDAEHGCTTHFVTAELDGGPLILQAVVPVEDNDDESTLAARVLKQEHRIYPMTIDWFAQGRLKVDDKGVWLDAKLLSTPATITADKDEASLPS